VGPAVAGHRKPPSRGGSASGGVALNKPSATSQYQGDAGLEQLLRDAGSPYDVAGISALLSGVDAAPEGTDPAAWIDLVAASPGDQLRGQLLALRDLRRSAGGAGGAA